MSRLYEYIDVFYLITPHPLQYFSGGAGAEGEIARYLDKNRALTKLGYNFTVASFRTKVDAFIMRNIDYGGCGMQSMVRGLLQML